jgi:hypothetical protein
VTLHRRRLLAALAAAGLAAGAGCSDRLDGTGVDTTFERVDTGLPAADPPTVTVEDGTVTARGTVRYGSSACGTVDLAHAAYEPSQRRLDLLVVAADDSAGQGACTDDLVEGGYRVEATVPDDLRRIAVTEHHVFGATYSAGRELSD